jgi:hypothetical protein
MAGTADDDTTSADWWLANAELAFVTKHVGSERWAKELLLDGLSEGLIRWGYHSLTIDDPPDPRAGPPLITSPVAARRFFWRPDEHSRIDMDWETNSATRRGPVMQLGSHLRNTPEETWPITTRGEEGETWPSFDLRGVATVKVKLVRFHHEDVVDILVRLGLMPRPPAPPPPSPPPQEPTPIAPAVQAALAASSSASPSEQPPPSEQPQPKEPQPQAAEPPTEPQPQAEPQPEKPQAEERELSPGEPKKRWEPKDAKNWLVQRIINDPPGKANWAQWARNAYFKMKGDFGEDIPWSDWETLRRRMNDQDVWKEVEKNRAR